MSHPFDATLKEILGQDPAALQRVFRLPSIEPARALNVDLSTLSAATDVAIGFGTPVCEIVDLNFQSGPDPAVAARLLLYNSAFHLKFAAPVRSILILLRPKADTPGLNGKLSYVGGGKRVRFDYEVIRLWTQPVHLFLEGGLGLLPLAPLCKMPGRLPLAQALRNVVREIDRRLALEKDRAQAARLMTAAFILTGMRIPKESLSHIYDGVKIMHESTAYDAIMDEGMLKGEIRTSQRILLKLGKMRFGAPGKRTETAVTGIQDLDRLQRMIEAILTANSWKDLLSVL